MDLTKNRAIRHSATSARVYVDATHYYVDVDDGPWEIYLWTRD